jgi:methyl-accepting chemotaxis protein
MSVTDRLFDGLRDAVRGARGVAGSARTTLDQALLFSKHEQASVAASQSLRTAQAAGATAAQQRSALEAAADHARLLVSRGRELRGSVQQVGDALERAKLVALNAGLEGARLGEPAGKAMVAAADELRSVIGRAVGALEEHLSLLTQVDREREKLRDQVDQAKQSASALGDELLRAQTTQRDAVSSLEELGKGLEHATGTDREVARIVATAADHARGLLEALGALSNRPQRSAVVRALRPTLLPLLRLMRELDRRDTRNGAG